MSSTSTLSPPPRITQSAYFPKAPSETSKAGKEAKALEKGKGKSKAEEVGGHTSEVLALALSHDGTILASGGKDKVIGVWNVEGEGGKWKRGLGGHKDKVAVRTITRYSMRRTDSHFAVTHLSTRNISALLVLVRSYNQALRPVDTIIHRDAIRTSRLYPERQRVASRGGGERRRSR